jgi:aryl-alcohol dehydrogenase-like predicted oxidoreductase
LTVDLHDVEFVTSHPFPFPKGDHRALLTASATGDDEYRLSPPYEPLGPGDAQILEGLAALKELQKEGKVRKIGIAGFPLPLLLRLSHLAANTPSVGPLDLVQTYGQQTVQNPSLEVYLPEFKKAGVRQIMNAAPLSMGILTTGGGPDWHPVNVAKGPVYDACREASQLCQDQGTSIEEVAVNFAYKGLKDGDRDIPVVIGCKVIDELKRTIKGWRAVNVPGEVSAETRAKIDTVEKQVEELFERKGIKGWSWQSPSPGSL